MATAETREEFEGQLPSGGGSSVSSLNSSRTPTSLREFPKGSGDRRASGDTNLSSAYANRWARALERCEKTLNKADYETVIRYDSPEKLVEGLDELQRENAVRTGAKQTLLSRLVDQIRPTQRSIQELLAIFIAAMMPNAVTSSLAFGLLYLCVKLCRDGTNASKSLEGMIAKIKRRLSLMARYSNSISSDENEEICLTFIDVFEDLILLWSHFVKYTRDHPPQTNLFQKDQSELEKMFQETLYRIDDSINYLGRLRELGVNALESHLQRTDLESRVSAASASFPIFLLPEEGTEYFVGHADLLATIHRYFKDADNEKDPLRIYSLCGIGGVGKTELAIRYAKVHSNAFDAIFWVGSESKGHLHQGFTKIALALGLPDVKVDGDPDHHLTLVHQWLRETNKCWLLIFDNMEKYTQIQRFLPFGCQGCVIVTSRYAAQAKLCRRRIHIVEPLSFSDSEALFLKLLHELPNVAENGQEITNIISAMSVEEKIALHFLLAQLGGLVLGIQQIVALIKHQQLEDDLPKFAGKYQRRPHNIYANSSAIAGHTLATLWEMSFAETRKKKDSFILLGIISCLQPDEIPETIFRPNNPSITEGDLSFCASEDDLDDAIEALRELSLIDRRRDKLSVHRLVQTAFLFQTDLSQDERQRIFNSASSLVDYAFPSKKKGHHMYNEWTACQTYIHHAISLATLYAWLQRVGHAVVAPQTFQHLMPACVWHLYECDSKREALEMVDIAISSSNDKHSLDYAQLLNSAMINYFKLNDIENARKVLEESRAIREQLLAPDSEELAATYANFGSIEFAEGHLDAALDYYLRAQKIRTGRPGSEAMLGLGHLCIGRVLFAKGDAESALREYKMCEELYAPFGQEHYLQVRINFTWGGMELAMGNYETARERLTHALRISLKQTPSDMKLAATYFKLGCIETELKRYHEAMDSLSKGLKIARLHGEDGSGEAARILRKQALVLERCPGSPEVLVLAEMQDSEHLRGEAEAILRKLRKGKGLDDDDEDSLFDSLVNPFNR